MGIKKIITFFSKKSNHPRIIISSSLTVVFLMFQNCVGSGGNTDASSFIPGADASYKIESYLVSDGYACQVQTSRKDFCKDALDNYQGEFENIIPSAVAPLPGGQINISSEISCELLKNGVTQCSTVMDDGSVDYVSNVTTDIGGTSAAVFDLKLDSDNVCVSITCGAMQ